MQHMLQRQHRLVLAILGAALLLFFWFWGVHPARGLDQGEVVQVVLATNRIQQSLWVTGYRPGDCRPGGDLDPAYTCYLSGEAAERLSAAVGRPSRSYYVLRMPGGARPLDEEPIHIVSFKLASGQYYLFVVHSLADADRGIFYGYRAEGKSIRADKIRWFRYTNPDLGAALKALRSGH